MQKERHSSHSKAVLLAVSLGLALWGAMPVAAETPEPNPPQLVKKPKKAQKPKPIKKIKATPSAEAEPRLPGGETRAERERRLLRECKGRPNAGACSGYAS